MFKRFISCILITCLVCLPAYCDESIDQISKNTDELCHGTGGEDGAYTSLAVSMLGWGLGLAAGIGVLAAVLHQSKAETVHADACQ